MDTQQQFHSLSELSTIDRNLFNQFGRGSREEVPFPLIHQAFEHVADLHPTAVAVRQHDGRAITYAELERRSNTLSNQLIESGLRPRQRVCLMFQRSINMVVAILAVLKANCQYVPLDGGVIPDEALDHIFQDTQTPVVICQEKYELKVRAHARLSMDVVVIQDNWVAQGNSSRPESVIESGDGAYIIYTSGMYLFEIKNLATGMLPAC
jgi:non-ribosomal peptide synthetase component F